jgi:hypothetical protein
MITRKKLAIGLMVLPLLVGVALPFFGVHFIESQVISSANFGGANVSVVSFSCNWLVVIPLGLVFFIGLVCLALSIHANRLR